MAHGLSLTMKKIQPREAPQSQDHTQPGSGPNRAERRRNRPRHVVLMDRSNADVRPKPSRTPRKWAT